MRAVERAGRSINESIAADRQLAEAEPPEPTGRLQVRRSCMRRSLRAPSRNPPRARVPRPAGMPPRQDLPTDPIHRSLRPKELVHASTEASRRCSCCPIRHSDWSDTVPAGPFGNGRMPRRSVVNGTKDTSSPGSNAGPGTDPVPRVGVPDCSGETS